MTWTDRAANSLIDTFGGSFDSEGVVVAAAAVDAGGTSIASAPVALPTDRRFEIGSVTKTMTATMLALLVGRGVLRLDDEIGRWLSDVPRPQSTITVRDLATHTSGLPAVAPNFRARQAAHPDNPWAGYTFELAEQGLREATPTPGNPWRYSNLGYQLLGLILERAGGQEFPALLAENLFEPLSMAHSGVGRRGAGTLLPGHAAGREVARWDHPLGAGGVEATIEDLGRYARACLFPPATPLGAAIELAMTPVVRVVDGVEQALAWAVHDGDVVEHSGGTGGFSACVTIDRRRGCAVALLVSQGGSPAFATHLKQAARMAVADQDPRQATAPQPSPTWREDAYEVVRALIDGQATRVHERMAPAMQRKLDPLQVENAWSNKTRDCGAAGRISLARNEIAASGAVVADVSIEFATGARTVRMVILPTGELGGLTILPSVS